MTMTVLPWRRALAANSTATDFTAKAPTATEPTGTGVFDLETLGLGVHSFHPRSILLAPYGGNDANDTFNLRLWAWSPIYEEAQTTPHNVWVPTLITELLCTLGSQAWTAVGANMLAADTIVVTDGPEAGEFRCLIDNANNVPAKVLVSLLGARKIEFDFDIATAADAMNCLWRPIDYK